MRINLADEHRRRGGLYVITNTLNGRIYVGSTKHFRRRSTNHLYRLQTRQHNNRFLQADYNKRGPEAFRFDVLEVLGAPKEELHAREEMWLAVVYDDGVNCYNLIDRAVSRDGSANKRPRFGVRRGPMSEETKRKISAANSGARNGNYGKRREGFRHSEETRRRLSEMQRGIVRGPMSEEHKRKIGDAQRGELNHAYGKEPWNKGKQASEEARRKMIEAAKGRVPWNKRRSAD
jgi:group I intron endonuclease